LFHEYFHGDIGRGVGASHQTGWTGLIAKLLQPRKPVVEEICPTAGRGVDGIKSTVVTLAPQPK